MKLYHIFFGILIYYANADYSDYKTVLSDTEANLTTTLLKNYNTKTRPRPYGEINVKLTIALKQMMKT